MSNKINNLLKDKKIKEAMFESAADIVFDLSEGNPGCMIFLMDCVLNSKNRNFAGAFSRMQYLGIKGEKLYLIWNDCCDRDTEKALDVMLKESYQSLLDHIDFQKNDGKFIKFE